MTPKEMIKVIQAFRDCKKIECVKRDGSERGWRFVKHPLWNFEFFDYREKPLTGYLNMYANEVCFHDTREVANRTAGKHILRCVKVQEVEEDA